MKKRVRVLACLLALVLVAISAGVGLAADIKVVVHGEPVVFADTGPVVVDGRTLVPVRAVAEMLGAKVEWVEKTQTVVLVQRKLRIELTIGSQTAFVNGQPMTLDVPATIIGNRTLVPLRFVAEAFGEEVEWDASTKTVYIGGRPDDLFLPPGGPGMPPVGGEPGMMPPGMGAMPDLNETIDAATQALQAMAQLGGKPGKLDQAALDLMFKQGKVENFDLTAEVTASLGIKEGKSGLSLDVSAGLQVSARGQDSLTKIEIFGIPGMPISSGMAVKDGTVWVKTGEEPWTKQPQRANQPSPTAPEVKPEKIKDLLKAAVGAGLADLTFGENRKVAGEEFQTIVVTVHGDAVVQMLKALAAKGEVKDLDRFSLIINRLQMIQLVRADGTPGPGEAYLDVEFDDRGPKPMNIKVKAEIKTDMHAPATGPIAWPPEIG